jgi:hypothetical protein
MPHRAAPVRRPAGPTLLLLACILPALAAPACTPEPPTPPPATSGFGAGAALHSPADAPLPGLVEDLGRFAGLDNEARGDTLLAIFRERGFEPAIHAFPNPQVEREPRPEGRNLVVEVGAGAREILVGAHYDAAPLPGGRYTAHRVRVALFDLEEWGLLGSAAFARELDPGAVAAMVNVDIAAYGTTIGYGPASHEGNEAVYQALATVCVVQAIPCLEFPAYPVSDDRTFQNAGIPNVSMAILERAEAHQLWLLLNGGPEPGIAEGFVPRVGRVIHTEEDRLEHAEAGAMTRMHDAVVALVLELDRVMRDG